MPEPSAMFESWRGLYADSPKVVSEALARTWPEVRRRWVVAGDQHGVPATERTVRRHRAAYFWRLATSSLLVTNDIVSRHVLAGPRTTYLQTWHGTPLKLLGHDEDRRSYTGADAHLRRMDRDVRHWDFLLSSGPTCTELFRSAFGFQGEVWETGLPRNDVLFGPGAPQRRAEARAALGLDDDTLAVLHAPTWRDDDKDEHGGFRAAAPLDLDLMAEAAPARTRFLVRQHRNVRQRLPEGVRSDLAVDVSDWPDVADLLLAADVLVSDYSSILYDAAALRIPLLCYVPDLDAYRDRVRGFYFDYDTWAPGPVLRDQHALAQALVDLPRHQERWGGRHEAFVERFGRWDDGGAADRVVARLREALA